MFSAALFAAAALNAADTVVEIVDPANTAYKGVEAGSSLEDGVIVNISTTQPNNSNATASLTVVNSSDIAAVLTKQIHDNGQMTDDERTILVSFMYPSSAPITNMISTQAPVLPIAVMALGPMILILVFCKLVGANIMRFIIACNNKKAKAKEAA